MEFTLEYFSNLAPGIITALAAVVVLAEWALLAIEKKIDSHAEAKVSILSAMLSFFPIFIFTKVLYIGLMFWFYENRWFELGFDWYVWLLAWVAYDFMFYLIHWLSHTVRLFWCFHSVHHTPHEMKLSVAFRGSFADFLLVPHNILWLPLLGFHPFMVLIVEVVGRFYGILVHVNESWFPNRKRHWIEKILVSPSVHRVHHSTNAVYLDRNYGEALSIWDVLFRTYQPELPDEKPVYGTMKEIDSEQLMDTQTSEFKALWRDVRAAPGWTDKLRYLFKPPGWNHRDGGKLGSTLRKEALMQKKLVNQAGPPQAGTIQSGPLQAGTIQSGQNKRLVS
jgi:sterol desaturase/sphingolipid hydroxylase (fatty acid hydroxylase superfamily)